MATRLDLAQEKLLRNARAARSKWVEMVKKAEGSAQAVQWKEFQKNAEKYVDIWLGNLERAIAEKKWARNYVKAFSTPAKSKSRS